MTISFRTRLFAIAALIVAAVLAAVMTLGWSSVLKFEVDRLDSRLCAEARRVARQLVREGELPRLEADLALKLRLNAANQLLLRFEPVDRTPGFQSAHWDNAFDIDAPSWKPAGRRHGEPPRPRSPPPADQPAGDRAEPPARAPPDAGACMLSSVTVRKQPWRAAMYATPTGRSVVAVDLAATKTELQGLVHSALTMMVPLALALTALGAWLLSSLTMRPVNRLREAMKHVTKAALDQRLSVHGEDREFRELIAAYNTMLERLELSFHQASRFSADAAHELKTPLTILQGRLEKAMNSASQHAVQADLTGMLDEVNRLSAITRKLLLLSQADAGRLALLVEPVDLTELLDALLSDARMLDSDRTVSGAIERELVTQGDALLLRQLCNNLISNAVRHGRPGGWIKVKGRRLSAGIEVLFANASHLLQAQHRQLFFDRFYRGDAAQRGNSEGSGLGLSLAREIARAHGGDLTLEAGAQDEVTLRLWLPVR